MNTYAILGFTFAFIAFFVAMSQANEVRKIKKRMEKLEKIVGHEES